MSLRPTLLFTTDPSQIAAFQAGKVSNMDSRALFIIGSPRSGTKLLRGLLNNHPDISLGSEGNFIPTLIQHFGEDADVTQRETWRAIYHQFTLSVFYTKPVKQGSGLSEEAFIAALDECSGSNQIAWVDIFEVLLRGYSPNPKALIYGDKSHGYINIVPLLRRLFKDVRFVFIVRDPRDQALSMRNTWGRSLLRSAHIWTTTCRHADQCDFGRADDALVVRYEDLSSDTTGALSRIYEFLEVKPFAGMEVLHRPVERERKGRQLRGVVTQQAKYKKALSQRAIRQISEIALPYLAKHGYAAEGVTRARRLSTVELRWLTYRDGLASLKFHMEEKGFIKGMRYYLRRNREARTGRFFKGCSGLRP
jgi:hypothetical protein